MMFVAGSLLSIQYLKKILNMGLSEFNIKNPDEYEKMSENKKEQLFLYLYDVFDYSLLHPEIKTFANMTLNEYFICNAIDRLYNEGNCTISPEQIINKISFFNKQKDKNELIIYVINIIEKYSNVKYIDKRKEKKNNFIHKYFHCIQSDFVVEGKTKILFTILLNKFNSDIAAI